MTARRTDRSAFVVAVGLVIAINTIGLPLRTDAAPSGIVSLQLATSVGAAEAILASWSAVATTRILVVHGLDVLLPIAYAVAITSWAARLGAGRASVAALVAAVADQAENALMAVSILDAPNAALVGGTLVAAVVKWGALAFALLVLGRGWSTARRTAVVA